MAGRSGRQRGVQGGRPVVRKVKLTAEHDRRLSALAESQGVTVARLLVETALGRGWLSPPARRALYAELLRLRRDVHGLGTNVNQLAAWANTEGRWAEEAALLALPIREAVEAIERTMRGLQQS